MISTQNLYWFSATAQASYADLVNANSDNLATLLLKGVDKDDLMSPAQAAAFAAEWSVINQLPDQPATPENGNGGGFSATLFQRTTGGNDYVLAFRGTMGMDDLAITDGGDIVVDGVASSQIIDLYNYWMALKTPDTQTYQSNMGQTTIFSELHGNSLWTVLHYC